MSEAKNKLKKVQNYDWKKLLFELIVVFLGVTAGFLLNDWQLQKKDQVLEKKYLAGFLQDVDANIIELKKAIEADSLWLNLAKPKLLEIQNKTLTIDSANTLIKQIVSISKADMQTGTYEDITNSGNLNLLTDFIIKKQIVDYHVTMSGVEFIDNYFYKYFGDFVMPFIFTNFNIIETKLVDSRIIKSNQFDNVIAGYYSMVQQRQTAYQDLLTKSYALRDVLKKE